MTHILKAKKSNINCNLFENDCCYAMSLFICFKRHLFWWFDFVKTWRCSSIWCWYILIHNLFHRENFRQILCYVSLALSSPINVCIVIPNSVCRLTRIIHSENLCQCLKHFKELFVFLLYCVLFLQMKWILFSALKLDFVRCFLLSVEVSDKMNIIIQFRKIYNTKASINTI